MDQEVSKMKKPMDLLFKKPLLMAFPNAELINEFGDFARRSLLAGLVERWRSSPPDAIVASAVRFRRTR